MKKSHWKAITIAIVVLCCTIALYTSPYSCSKRITNAIDNGKTSEFEQIVQRNSRGINYQYYRTNLYRLYEGTNFYPLHYACDAGNVHMVRILLENGADPNVIDRMINRSPLIFALESGKADRFKIAHLLIDYGADITYEDKRGFTPLISSLLLTYDDSEKTKREEFELFKRILEAYGIDKAKKEPILQEAATFGNRLAVDYILKNNIQNINYISDVGETPLMGTAFTNDDEMCRYLLENGADKSIRDNEGKTAYDYAVQYGHKEVAELCKE